MPRLLRAGFVAAGLALAPSAWGQAPARPAVLQGAVQKASTTDPYKLAVEGLPAKLSPNDFDDDDDEEVELED